MPLFNHEKSELSVTGEKGFKYWNEVSKEFSAIGGEAF